MKGFTTPQDRVNKATGAESSIDWENLPADVAEQLLDKISKGKNENDIEDTPETTCTTFCGNTVNVFGYTLTLQEVLGFSCLTMQIIALIVTIIIACKIRK